ncbi:hypothetical protein D7X74_41265, partial [Corallococcus sp. CA047B]
MRNIWKVGALGAVFGAVLSVGGCQDFDAAYEKCVAEGRCEPDGGTADAGDGGRSDAGDAGPECIPSSIPDQPDDQGLDTDCDGVDGVADAGYFVDPAGGNDTTGDGSRERPFGTLAHALEQVRTNASGRTTLYLARGTYNEASTEVTVPVSLHGGYSRRGTTNDWDRFTDGGTLIDGGTLAFTVRDVTDARVLLDGLHIASNDALNDSESSIALRAIHTANLQLHNTRVEAGLGGPGNKGSPASPDVKGAPGIPGGAAQPSGTGSIPGDQGTGGTSTCSVSGAGVGGPGGSGVVRDQGETGGTGEPATKGGAGGADAGPVDNSGAFNCVGGPGLDGDPGAEGTPGGPGDAGFGMGFLNVDAGVWVTRPTQKGAPGVGGRIGAGGGGGGSGGTCSDRTVKATETAASG